jgi:hypothetical protein
MSETKMVRVEKFKTSLEFLRDRAHRARKVAQSWEGDGKELAELNGLLNNVALAAERAVAEFETKMAKGWSPPRAAATVSPLTVGDKVHVRDRFAKSFEGQLTTRDVLTVTKIGGKRIHAHLATDDGVISLSLARNQVRRAGEVAATDDEEVSANEKSWDKAMPGVSDLDPDADNTDLDEDDDEEGEDDEDAA